MSGFYPSPELYVEVSQAPWTTTREEFRTFVLLTTRIDLTLDRVYLLTDRWNRLSGVILLRLRDQGEKQKVLNLLHRAVLSVRILRVRSLSEVDTAIYLMEQRDR